VQTQLEHRNPTTAHPSATRVLAVDDDRDFRELLVELLEGEPYEVSSAVHPKPFLVDEVVDTVHRLAGRVAPWHTFHFPEEKTK
jgi:PleD family two-component response regulator